MRLVGRAIMAGAALSFLLLAAFSQKSDAFQGDNVVERNHRQIEDQKWAKSRPIEVRVDCNAGDTVTRALERLENHNGLVTITIVGTCNESVIISRDDITLQGVSQEDCITGDMPILVTNGSSRVKLNSMTLRGQFAGLTCSYRGVATATNLKIVDGQRGVSSFYGGTCIVADSLISNNFQGVTIGDASTMRLEGTTIEKGTIGASVFTNGSLTLDSSSDTKPSLIRDNVIGVDLSSNATLRPVNTRVENNMNDGIIIRSGGVVYIADFYNASINGNGGDGIAIKDLGKIHLSPALSVTNNGGYGVNCQNIVVLENSSSPPTITDNKLGSYSSSCGVSALKTNNMMKTNN